MLPLRFRICAALLVAAALCAQDRADILRRMEQVMGPFPNHARGPLDVEVLEEERLPQYLRRKITFAVEPGDRVPAYLLIPHEPRGRKPAVLCLHQTTKPGKAEPAGLAGKPDLHYAAELAGRGFVALAPDYPNFGDYVIDVYARGYQSATMKGVWNHSRAVDLLTSLADVDPRRIAAIGHSLGGHNSLFVAAFDQRISTAVTSCGFTSFAKYKGGDLTGWSHRGYMPRIATVYERSPAKMPFDFTDVLLAIAPRAVFIAAPLRDSNFEVSGVKDVVAAVEARFRGRLRAVYPDAAHEFPPAIREEAYRFLMRRQ
jgi:dienelactone hydrolase